MKILCGKQIPLSGFKPPLFIQALAFGAVAVTAGVVGYPQGTTMVAFLHMATKLGSAASLDGPHGPQVSSRHLMAVNLSINGTVGPKNIGHFKGTSHGKPLF